MVATVQYRPAGALSDTMALAPYDGPWNRRVAGHLLRRAGFGGTPEDVSRLAAMPMNAAVDSLIHFSKDDALAGSPDDTGAVFEQLRDAYQQLRRSGGDPDALKDAQKAFAKSRRQVGASMERWWLGRMIKTKAPLQEKMTLFWHGRFTTAFSKGITPRESLDQNWLFRSNALGNARELTLAVSQDPAMLKYLDNDRNVADHPNENYARELMELYTLGIGNYTESDVRESARAFSGWNVRGPLAGGGFYFNQRKHDFGSKTFLGHTGNLDGKDIVEIIYQQPAAARFLATGLLNFFVYNEPEPHLVDAVAEQLRKHDFQTAPVMSMLLRSNVFFSERAYRALVKSPVEYVVGAHQLFGLSDVSDEALLALGRMGQRLFYPPSVKGWDGGAAWLNSQTVLARENYVNYLVGSQMQQMQGGSWLVDGPPPTAQQAVAKLVGTILLGDASPRSSAELLAYLDGAGTSALGALSGENYEERMRGAAYLTMALPAYQLN
jgi:hypothetical protein